MTEQWTPERIARDRALCDAASTWPWKADKIANAGENWMIGTVIHLGCSSFDDADWIVTTDRVRASEFDGDAKDDAAFISAARTELPAALDEIERLRALLDGLKDPSVVEINMLRGEIAVPPKRDRDRTERLEGLLRECAVYVMGEELSAKIRAELGDGE